MTTTKAKTKTSKEELALQNWLGEMQAMAVALDTTPDARAVLLDDAAADAWIVDQAAGAHPVLVARGHLAHAAIQLLRDDAEAAFAHAQKAVEIGSSLAAPGPRLAVLPQAGALAAMAVAQMRSTRRREAQRVLVDVAARTAEAYGEQAELSRRGIATLTAALALVEGSKRVRGEARLAVLSRARDLAFDARRDLARAGEVAKARLASETMATLDIKLG